jgi:hypothetical protein
MQAPHRKRLLVLIRGEKKVSHSAGINEFVQLVRAKLFWQIHAESPGSLKL